MPEGRNELLAQSARSALIEERALASDYHRQAFNPRSKVHNRLPRRVAGAHERNLFARAKFGFRRRRPIVNVDTLEALQIRHGGPFVAGPRGYDPVSYTHLRAHET